MSPDLKTHFAGETVGKQVLLCIAGGSTKWHNLYLTILIKITHKSTYSLIQQSQLWEFILEICLLSIK